MAFDGPREVVASAARTTTGNSGALRLRSMARNISLLVDVTAASGTGPTLALSVEWSHDGGTTFAAGEPADTFTQISAASKAVKRFDVKAPDYRIVWTIGGTTPSFTFSAREYLT
mgnify:CR=1 FL=1